jgi:nucleotide-binding universal stress UspA family protein
MSILVKKREVRHMYSKILVPLDGSGLAAQILPQVEELAKTFNSKITLMTVGKPLPESTAAELSDKDTRQISARMKADAEKNLSAHTSAMKAKGLNVNSVYAEGVPALEIISYASKKGYDLIAMATHGRGEIAWVLGSVAEKVVSHATVPVLLLRVLPVKQPVSKKDYADRATIDNSEMPA